MRMPAPEVQRQTDIERDDGIVQTKPFADTTPQLIQRQAEEIEDEEESIQAKSRSNQPNAIEAKTYSQIQSLKGGGRPLPESSRAFFEPRFGTNFSQVRVHTDNEAAIAARNINARAFTASNNIAFASGEFSPETASGRKLLAHELTHIVQQRAMPNLATGAILLQRQPGTWASAGDVLAYPSYDAPGDAPFIPVAAFGSLNQTDFQDLLLDWGRERYSGDVWKAYKDQIKDFSAAILWRQYRQWVPRVQAFNQDAQLLGPLEPGPYPWVTGIFIRLMYNPVETVWRPIEMGPEIVERQPGAPTTPPAPPGGVQPDQQSSESGVGAGNPDLPARGTLLHQGCSVAQVNMIGADIAMVHGMLETANQWLDSPRGKADLVLAASFPMVDPEHTRSTVRDEIRDALFVLNRIARGRTSVLCSTAPNCCLGRHPVCHPLTQPEAIHFCANYFAMPPPGNRAGILTHEMFHVVLPRDIAAMHAVQFLGFVAGLDCSTDLGAGVQAANLDPFHVVDLFTRTVWCLSRQ